MFVMGLAAGPLKPILMSIRQERVVKLPSHWMISIVLNRGRFRAGARFDQPVATHLAPGGLKEREIIGYAKFAGAAVLEQTGENTVAVTVTLYDVSDVNASAGA